MPPPVLQIISPHLTPRLRYAVGLIFRHILGIDYVLQEQQSGELPTVQYGGTRISGAFFLPEAGLLSTRAYPPVDPAVQTEGGLPLLFYSQQNPTAAGLPFDLFSAAFFLATEYEKWASQVYDRHGRYDQPRYRRHAAGWDAQPLVHLYAQRLWESLIRFFPALQQAKIIRRSFDYELTFDIDFPWKYLHKPLWVQVGGFFKDLLQGRFAQLTERAAAHLSGNDPYYTFNRLFAHFPVAKTRFFFLIDRHAPEDSRFTWRLPALQQLILEIRDRGYRFGIHPSYTSLHNPDRIKEETEALALLTGRSISCSRQHFLRYRLPDTFRTLIGQGIRHEYSVCAFHTGGFPTGMAIPYPWYDLESETETALTLHPTILMDRTLEGYKGVRPEAVAAEISRWIAATRAVGGVFTLLLHNDCLSESGEWKGWREPILAVVQTLTNEKK